MTPNGGGSADISDLLRSAGKAAIYAAAEAAGLAAAHGRLRCPFLGCADKADKSPSVTVFSAEGGKYKLKCHRCSSTGDLLDLLELTLGLSRAQAVDHLRGVHTSAPRPALRVVPAAPAADPDKLLPAEVRRVWDGLAKDDELGRRYLEGRGLEQSPLVRFAVEASGNKLVQRYARDGRRVAMLLSDVVGEPRGIQFRLARQSRAKEPSQLTMKGSTSSGAFFGQPELIEQASLVLVGEGMADTLAIGLWVGAAGVVVGAAGKDGLHKLAECLKAAGISVDGKVFALFPQNDRPKNLSRREFVRLSQLLAADGAHVVLCGTPDEWKDVAAWRQGCPDVAWPPAELAKAMGGEQEQLDDSVRMVRPAGGGVPVAARITTAQYGQNFTSLCALLDDPVPRAAIMGPGEFATSEMTGDVLFNGRALAKTDLSAIRLGLEEQGRADGKPLKFSGADIVEAIALLASRKSVHPIRDWLRTLKWDGTPRIDDGLTKALGQTEGLACHLLRKWIISVVARPLSPGCQMDTVLVLAGPEGEGKSAFFRTIGGQWFTDEKLDIEEDNGKRLMRRSWIIEWAELNSMRRARDQESIKAFVSKQTDSYRPLWSEALVESPRHSVIVGSTNHEDFLAAANGNRRIWPLWVERVDLAWVRTHREQLLAEAVVLFDSGEQWHLEPEYRPLLTKLNQSYEERDDWEALILEWAPFRNGLLYEVTGARILEEVIKKPAGQWTANDKKRIGQIMGRLGWVIGKSRSGGKAHSIYRKPVTQ